MARVARGGLKHAQDEASWDRPSRVLETGEGAGLGELRLLPAFPVLGEVEGLGSEVLGSCSVTGWASDPSLSSSVFCSLQT